MTKIEYERRKRRWSQFELSKRIDRHPSYISLAERGVSPVAEEFQKRVSSALELPVEKLFTADGRPKAI